MTTPIDVQKAREMMEKDKKTFCICEHCKMRTENYEFIESTLDALVAENATLRGERNKLRIWCDACEGTGHTGAHPHELCSQCSGYGWIKWRKP